jgi:hypothetical protein
MVEPNSIQDITISLSHSTPVSRDIRVSLVDPSTGNTINYIEDQVKGSGEKQYVISISMSESTIIIDAVAEFLHGDEWIISDDAFAFEVTVQEEIENNTIPGYPPLVIILGVVFAFVLRKYYY